LKELAMLRRIFWVLFPALWAIFEVRAADILVDEATETGNDGLCSLIEALVNAEDDAATWPDCAAGDGADRLLMTGVHSYGLANPLDGALNGLPEITGPLEILGNGSTIQRLTVNALRLFAVDGATVRFQDLNLVNGFSAAVMVGGGAVWVRGGAEVTFANVRFESNSASGVFGFGGALRMDESAVRIQDSLFIGNEALSASPEVGGGAIAQFDGLLEVHRSAFIDNAADLPCNPSDPDPVISTGGALRIEGIGTLAQASFSDSTLAGNLGRVGGAIHVVAISDTGQTPDVVVTLNRSTVVGNQSCAQGDGLYIQETPGNSGVIQYNGSIIHGNGIELAGAIVGEDCSSNTPSQDFFSLDGNVLDPDDQCTTFGFDLMASDLDLILEPQRQFDHYLLRGDGAAVDNADLFIFCAVDQLDQLGRLRGAGPGQGGSRCDPGAVEYYAVATQPVTVTLSGSGAGRVISMPGGIDCPGSCSAEFGEGLNIQLNAIEFTGSDFQGWSGDCQGTGPCLLDMSEPRAVDAEFELPGDRIFDDRFETP
jgi:hypothetical protein